ncbi:hypothetical protein BKA57DRAFT_477022 [Linnemannia elongata]|nr:hypothetical protein BKA57DRAFT_477022 [Linnemannia elongata]
MSRGRSVHKCMLVLVCLTLVAFVIGILAIILDGLGVGRGGGTQAADLRNPPVVFDFGGCHAGVSEFLSMNEDSFVSRLLLIDLVLEFSVSAFALLELLAFTIMVGSPARIN